MNPRERQNRVDELFITVCDEVAQRRPDLLRRLASSETPSVLAELSELLAADEALAKNSEFLSPSALTRWLRSGADDSSQGDAGSEPDDDGKGSTWLHDDETTCNLQATHFGSSSIGGRFVVQRPLARGGLGQVSVAIDRELEREVALKEMREDLIDHPACRLRFVREATITGGLEHPGIVPVYARGVHADGRPFYAMRLIEGQTLKEAISELHEEGRERTHFETRLRRLLTRFDDVCQAMAYAHKRGVLHRDLKPSNVMLGEHGETLIVDWGLALRFRIEADETDPLQDGKSSQGSVGSDSSNHSVLGGTPFYSSPEQLRGNRPLDERSDVYSLGVTLYFILTGRTPFETFSEALADRRQRKFPRPTVIHRQVPKALEAICLRAMSFDPAERYSDCSELGDDIERWLAGEPVRAWQEPWNVSLLRWGRRHITWIASATAVLITLVAALLVTMLLINKERAELADVNQKLEDQQQRVDETNDFLRNQVDETARLARVGQRMPSLQLIQRSIQLERETLSPDNIFQLRDWAIHALAKSDLQVEHQRHLPTIVGRDVASGVSTKWQVAFSPGLNLYAVAMETGEVKVFREHDDVLLATISSGAPIQGVLKFSPDSRYLALKDSSDSRVHLWDWEKQTEVFVTEHPVANSAFDFHPSSRQFIVGRERVLEVYSVDERRMSQRIKFGFIPLSLAYSPRGDRVAVTSRAQPKMMMIHLADRESRSIPMPHADAAFSVAWHPNERWLASACADQSIYLWDASSHKIVDVLPTSGPPAHVNFNHDGGFLAVTLRDGTMELWDVTKKEQVATAGGVSEFWHPLTVDSPRFAMDGRRLAHGYDGTTLTTWHVENSVVKRLLGTPGGLRSGQVLLHPQTGLILTASDDAVRLWDPAQRREVGRLLYPKLTSIALSSDGQQLFASTPRGVTVRELSWDTSTDGTTLLCSRPDTLRKNVPVYTVAVSSDGKYAFAAFKEQLSRIELSSRRWHTLVSRNSISSVAVHPEAPLIAIATNNPEASEIWNYEESERVIQLEESGGARVAFSPDGRFLAVNSRNRCSLYVAPTWNLAYSYPKQDALALGTGSLSFTPDSRFLIFAESRHRLSVIDLETGHEHLGLEDANRNSGVACCFDVTSTKLFVNQGDADHLEMWDLRQLHSELLEVGLPAGSWLEQLSTFQSNPHPDVALVEEMREQRGDKDIAARVQEAIATDQWQSAAAILRMQQEQDAGDFANAYQLALVLNYLEADDEYRLLRSEMLERFEYLAAPLDVLNLLMACLVSDIDDVNYLPIELLLRKAERIPPRYWATPKFELLQGLFAYRRGDWDEARRFYELVLAVPPEKEPLRFLTAEILETLVEIAEDEREVDRKRLLELSTKLDELRNSFPWQESLIAETLLREAYARLDDKT